MLYLNFLTRGRCHLGPPLLPERTISTIRNSWGEFCSIEPIFYSNVNKDIPSVGVLTEAGLPFGFLTGSPEKVDEELLGGRRQVPDSFFGLKNSSPNFRANSSRRYAI